MNFVFWISLTAQLFALLVGTHSFRKNSISLSGFFALLFISSLFIWLGYIELLLIQYYMFASSSFITNYKKDKKKEFEKVVSKSGPRDYIQAFCNLGVGLICMLLYFISKHNPVFLAAFIGSVAAANADSWASEIGGLSKTQPVLITNFKKTEKGISGGITLLGTLGGIAGAFFIVFLSVLTFIFIKIGSYRINELLFYVSFIAVIMGFLLDSYIGACFQALYRHHTSNNITESETNNDLIKGYAWLNNDMVNLITTFLSGLIAGGLYLIGNKFFQ